MAESLTVKVVHISSGKTMNLDEMLDFAQNGAFSIIQNTDEQVQPVFMAENDEGEAFLFQVEWSNPEEKNTVLEFIKEKFREHKVVRYVHACEAWTVVAEEENISVRPSEHPDRIDTLIIIGVERNGTNKMRSFKIKRGTDQPLVPFERSDKVADLRGKMFDLIEKEKKVLH